MKAREIFLAAVKMGPEGWPAYLSEACGGDEELRRRVANLLQAHQNAGSFLEPDATPSGAALDQAPGEHVGAVLGNYKLLEQIGEGGFGVVFMAEQQQPIRRKVALKILKPGMDTKQVIARFEVEQQVLALMDHPNIARVLEAGQTSGGRPYFVMDLVKGVPITEFCDQSQLPPKERLELFVHVCQAVQHAHQKGIIHRDIKPSNVLVTLHDGTPLVKVIDFGIAKALGEPVTDKTLFTGFAQMVGTPLYMSPEQAALSNVDVDTRSDIYSLGVLLYELLTGTTPFGKERFKEVGYDELRRIIREEEPPRPSTRISTLGQAATTVSANRKTDPKRLRRLFRGELDWIVMKSLEKDRNRRYESASSFAADVQRFLHDEPVLACPPSAWYRWGKFVRRNKASLAVAMSVLAVTLALAGSAIWFGQQQAVRRAHTELNVMAALSQAQTLLDEGDKQIDHPERWQTTARLARGALKKAEEMLAAGEATEELAAHVRQLGPAVEEAVIDSGLLVELDRIRLEQSAVKANRFQGGRAAPLYAKLLANYGVDIAMPAAAGARLARSRLREVLAAALEDWRRVTPDEQECQRVEAVLAAASPPDTFYLRWRAAYRRGDIAELVKLADHPSARRLPPSGMTNLASDLERVNELTAAERLLRAGQERYPGDFWLNQDLGALLLSQGRERAEEAAGFLRVALALRPGNPGVYLNLGNALRNKGDLAGAIHCYRAAMGVDPRYATAHASLGRALIRKGDLEEGVRFCRIAVEIAPDDIHARSCLGNALFDKGDIEGAIREHRAALAIDPRNAGAHSNLGNALRDKGDLEGAIREFRVALGINPKLAEAHCSLARVLARQGDDDGAIRACRAALAIDPTYASAHYLLGTSLLSQENLDAAIHELRTAVDITPKDAQAHNNLGRALWYKGDEQGALREYRTALKIDPQLFEAHCNLGWALRRKGRLDEAIAECREAIRLKASSAEAHVDLGAALHDRGLLDEAITEYKEAIRLKNDLPQAHYNFGNALRDKGRHDEAIAEYREAIRFKKDYAEAHCNLGNVLLGKGQFSQALVWLRRGHELGSRNPRWRHPTAQWIRDCERLVALDNQLPDFLSGKRQPADTAERLAIAQMCQEHRRKYVAALQFYAAAFAAEPKLVGDQPSPHRYDAACAAALAGCGQGEGAPSERDKERPRLRRQALDWLRGELAAWRRLVEKDQAKTFPRLGQQMQHWQTDPDFAGVRGADALRRLPSEERSDWQKLWREVQDLRQRAAAATDKKK
jgi:tetratricopeptide (TPR) repeat protein